MCRRDGCDCDAGGLDALEGRLWAVREPVWCPECGLREVADGLWTCILCEAVKP